MRIVHCLCVLVFIVSSYKVSSKNLRSYFLYSYQSNSLPYSSNEFQYKVLKNINERLVYALEASYSKRIFELSEVQDYRFGFEFYYKTTPYYVWFASVRVADGGVYPQFENDVEFSLYRNFIDLSVRSNFKSYEFIENFTASISSNFYINSIVLGAKFYQSFSEKDLITKVLCLGYLRETQIKINMCASFGKDLLDVGIREKFKSYSVVANLYSVNDWEPWISFERRAGDRLVSSRLEGGVSWIF